MPLTDQHEIKRRLQLDPRDSAKTTFGRVDSVQWLLAFPVDATILSASATQPLGRAISKSIAQVFYQERSSEEKPLHVLYPELVTRKEPFKGKDDDSWNTRSHNDLDMDFSLRFTSPQSTQSGWHPWIMNPDDMVDTKNSGIRANNEVREGVISTYETNKNAVREGGFINMRGTRYHPFELYGKSLSTLDIENPEESGWKLLIRSAVIWRDNDRLEPGRFPPEDQVELPFKAMGLTYAVMRRKFLDDYESFMCQQQNDPLGGMVPIFNEKMFTSSTITPERVPTHRDGQTYICWRLPWGMKKETSHLEGACVRIADGRLYVVDAWQGNYIPSRLAEHIVAEQKKHRADGVLLLDTPGAEAMWQPIKNEAARKNISMPLQWSDWMDDAIQRAETIKQMEPMMKSGRIVFSTGATKAVEVRRQFVNFGLVQETGIVECIQKLTNMAPLSALRANLEDEEIEMQTRAQEHGLYHSLMSQQGGRTVINDAAIKSARAHVAAMQRTTTMTRLGFPSLPGGLDG